jgi:hypothetical protein
VICVYLRQARAQRAPQLRASASQSVFRCCSSGKQDHGDSLAPTAGNQAEQLIDHGVARREHGETRRATRKEQQRIDHGISTDLHGGANTGRSAFQFKNKSLC